MAEFNYANLIGWTEVCPYEIIRRTAKTIDIRKMAAKLDPTWKPEVIPGGFSGQTINNTSQRWIITPNKSAQVIRAYLRIDGKYHSEHGRHMLSETPKKFYDYNF